MTQSWPAAESVLNGEARHVLSRSNCLDSMRFLPDKSVDFVCIDPPYSRGVHASVRSAKRNELPDADLSECRTRRVVDLGFEHLRPEVRRAAAREFARIARGWVAAFSDIESCHLWRISLEAAGLPYIRTSVWHRLDGAPQFSGDRPASAVECITLAHPTGRKSWNGGGKAGFYEFPIVLNRSGHRGSRVHPTQKPIELMLALIEDFTDADDLVLDGFMGSGTTGVAALQLGRRFIGMERDETHYKTACDRIAAHLNSSNIAAHRAGQEPLFAIK